jgi:hypothetical protein
VQLPFLKGDNMKKLLVLLSGILVMLAASPLYAEVVDGFRSVKCGDSFDNWKKEMISDSQKGDVDNRKFYRRKDDPLRIGNATLSNILYIFADGKFEAAYIDAEGYLSCTSLKEESFAKFGENPDKLNRYPAESYTWNFGSVKVSFHYKAMSEQCNLSISCRDTMK